MRRGWLRWGALGLAVLLGGLGLYVLPRLPDVAPLREGYPVFSKRKPGEVPEVKIVPKRPKGWVRLEGISKVLQGAVLVSEDWAFYEHPGFDWLQIRRTLEDSASEGRLTRGASTITQQVAKNLYLSSERSLLRKLRELLVSLRLERTVGKRKILEVYLNVAEWGPGLYGIGAASWHYFSKAPSALSAKESAFLAMLLPSPRRYSQSFRDRRLSPFARSAVASILAKMEQAQHISAEERQAALENPLSFEVVAEPQQQQQQEEDLELEDPWEDSEAEENLPLMEDESELGIGGGAGDLS